MPTTEVFEWRVWCETEQVYVHDWAPGTPTVCPNNAAHSIDADKTTVVSSVRSTGIQYPRGSGVRFRTPCFTAMAAPFEVTCAAGKKLMMLTSKCTFREDLVDLPKIVFEVHKLIDLGGGPTYFIVDQNYYDDLADLVVDADRVIFSDGVYRLDFDWPGLDSTNREPTVLDDTMKLKVYMTDDAEHAGVGQGGSYLYFEPVPGVRLYNPYGAAASPPSWPATPPSVKLAHVCFHCIAFDADEV